MIVKKFHYIANLLNELMVVTKHINGLNGTVQNMPKKYHFVDKCKCYPFPKFFS